MGPLSYLPSGLPETIGQNILPYSIGDRGSTENTEWDTLQFVKVGSQLEADKNVCYLSLLVTR